MTTPHPPDEPTIGELEAGASTVAELEAALDDLRTEPAEQEGTPR